MEFGEFKLVEVKKAKPVVPNRMKLVKNKENLTIPSGYRILA
jgi:hypothetical protein